MMRGFSRFSPSGCLFLLTYITITKTAFNWSIYGDSLNSGEFATSSSGTLNGIIMAMSLLNVISHCAVILGALDDSYVLSILVGVGFDVLTQILRLIWWVQLGWIAFHEQRMKQ
ncbi:hypothetical protein ACHAXR_002268 [Thalassiosira sp. AJA248-18]